MPCLGKLLFVNFAALKNRRFLMPLLAASLTADFKVIFGFFLQVSATVQMPGEQATRARGNSTVKNVVFRWRFTRMHRPNLRVWHGHERAGGARRISPNHALTPLRAGRIEPYQLDRQLPLYGERILQQPLIPLKDQQLHQQLRLAVTTGHHCDFAIKPGSRYAVPAPDIAERDVH